MGNCCGSASAADKTISNTNGHLNSGPSRSASNTTSLSTSNTTSTSISSGSGGGISAGSLEEAHLDGQMLPTPNLREFTFQELKAATRSFKSDALIGEGGFGKVYRGWLDERQPNSRSGSGTVVAVKKLNSESLQGFEEWQSEVNFLGRLSHPNLVRLLGYCWDERELLLVYEFMQRGSLENHLFGRGASVQPLPWEVRLNIAIGAARGLAFLHSSKDRVLIYRDIKAANILLDSAYNAKISDFGLAKLGPSESQSHVTTRVMGSYGYAAPEYLATGHLYVKSDVYGFGVVLVELLTGKRALDPARPNGQLNLVDWTKPFLSDKRKLKSIMDSQLEGRYPSKAATEMAALALKCISQGPRNRPSMQEVVTALERIQAAKEKPTEPEQQPSRSVAQQPLRHRSKLHPK